MTKHQYSTDLFAAHAAIDAEIERLSRMLDVYESGPRSAGVAGEREHKKMQALFDKACDERIPLDDAVIAAPISD